MTNGIGWQSDLPTDWTVQMTKLSTRSGTCMGLCVRRNGCHSNLCIHNFNPLALKMIIVCSFASISCDLARRIAFCPDAQITKDKLPDRENPRFGNSTSRETAQRQSPARPTPASRLENLHGSNYQSRSGNCRKAAGKRGPRVFAHQRTQTPQTLLHGEASMHCNCCLSFGVRSYVELEQLGPSWLHRRAPPSYLNPQVFAGATDSGSC